MLYVCSSNGKERNETDQVEKRESRQFSDTRGETHIRHTPLASHMCIIYFFKYSHFICLFYVMAFW